MSAPTAFYCVTDRRYFLGAVALTNSLRLLGHREPIYVLDCGLEEGQRRLLGAEVELVAAPAKEPPWLLKTIAPLRHPAEVMVLIDVDMIATRPLGELIERARSGRILAFANDRQRFVPEWGELLELGPVRRQPYVSSGFVALGREPGLGVLELLADRQRRVDFERTFWRANERDYPFLYADQCVLNAILASQALAPERLEVLPHRLAPTPPFRGLRVVDSGRLRCAYGDGAEPYVVHHFTTKPWLESTFDGVYSRLLRRLVDGEGIAVRVPPSQLPRRLRQGARGYASRKAINARERFRWHVGDPLAERLGRRAAAGERR